MQSAEQSTDYKSNLYIPVCHTNRRPIKNTISVVVNRLVGMALKGYLQLSEAVVFTVVVVLWVIIQGAVAVEPFKNGLMMYNIGPS